MARQKTSLYFGVAERRGFAGGSHRATQSQFAAAAERKTVDRADRRLADSFEKMEHALAKQRKILSVYRCLLRELSNVRASNKRLLARSGQDQHTHAGVVTRIQQSTLQFFHCFAIQRIQYFRTIERDFRDAVFFLKQNIFVAHCALLTLLAGLALFKKTRVSARPVSAGRCSHKSHVLPCVRSSPPAPYASTAVARRTDVP